MEIARIIKIKDDVYEKLKEIKSESETFSDTVNRILSFSDKYEISSVWMLGSNVKLVAVDHILTKKKYFGFLFPEKEFSSLLSNLKPLPIKTVKIKSVTKDKIEIEIEYIEKGGEE